MSGVSVPGPPNRFAGVHPGMGLAAVPHAVPLSCVAPKALAVWAVLTEPLNVVVP